MPTNIESQIRAKVEEFVDELSALIRQAAVESVTNAFGANGAAHRRGPGRPRKASSSARPRGKGGRRRAAELEAIAEKLLAQIKKAPGSRMEQISVAIGASTRELMRPTFKLLQAGAIRKRGQRRATTYHAR